MDDLLKLQSHLERDKVYPALENSRRGGHLWIFFAQPQPARDCRLLVYQLAERLGVAVKGAGLPEGIEVFPKQDQIQPGEFGNAIRGPLGIHREAGKRFWFYGANYDFESQISYLNRLPKVTGEQLRALISGKPVPAALAEQRSNPAATILPRTNHHAEFRILEHVSTQLRKVGRNYVTRCPSCAEAGHDRDGDNLSVSVEDPRKYKCWAGCTKEMIRAALGCPIRRGPTAYREVVHG